MGSFSFVYSLTSFFDFAGPTRILRPPGPSSWPCIDGTAHKTEQYARFTPLCGDGVFWSAVWEVRVNRSEKVRKKKTDQWIQREGSVELVALWLCGRRHEEMKPGSELSEAWNPMLEAKPYS